VTNEEHLERGLGALRYPQLLLGMLAIFVYVGTEVSIQSNLPRWYEEAFQVPEDEVGPRIAHFISLYWGSLMIGRWTAGMSFFNLGRVARRVATVVVPFVAYAVVLLVNAVKGSPMNDLVAYAPFVLILVAAFFVAQDRPARTMLLFGVLGGVMMLAGLAASGKIALYCLVAGGLFCSVMWPNIFALSIAGLGRYTSQGAALLVMMILGGALIPPLQGYVADVSNIHVSYLVPLVGFAYLAAYGVLVGRSLRRQGVVFEQA
jgi:MFS transporter, FHS family, L-fucose permease